MQASIYLSISFHYHQKIELSCDLQNGRKFAAKFWWDTSKDGRDILQKRKVESQNFGGRLPGKVYLNINCAVSLLCLSDKFMCLKYCAHYKVHSRARNDIWRAELTVVKQSRGTWIAKLSYIAPGIDKLSASQKSVQRAGFRSFVLRYLCFWFPKALFVLAANKIGHESLLWRISSPAALPSLYWNHVEWNHLYCTSVYGKT